MAEYCGKCHRGVRDYRDGRGWIHVGTGTPERDCFKQTSNVHDNDEKHQGYIGDMFRTWYAYYQEFRRRDH
jgi:hypothetical protein